MIFDGSLDSFFEIRRAYPQAMFHGMARRTQDMGVVFDFMYGEPMVKIDNSWFAIGEEIAFEQAIQ